MIRSCLMAVVAGAAVCVSGSIGAAAGQATAADFPGAPGGGAAAGAKKPDFPKFDDVVKDLEKVVSTADGSSPLIDLYKDDKTGKLLGVLPRGYENKLMLIACTISGGDPQAGVMGPTYYVKAKRYDKTIALVQPNFNVRTDGDRTAQDSIDQLYTGRILETLPIVTMAPGGRPVVDLGAMAIGKAGSFFGPAVFSGYGPSLGRVAPGVKSLTKAKTFPENAVIEYEVPRTNGQLIRLTYSIGELEGTRGFKPRKADPRVGYFYNYHADYAKPANTDVMERYISRWHFEKADPKLKLSPPKQPLVWYIEHTTPIQYRRYVREGILMWNDAFEDIGITGALEVYQQDAGSGSHMDKDPEDARYNFFRWNASNQGYAIGPSRTNPETGEILDADVVWHQGLTRSVRSMLENLSDDIAVQHLGPETMAWLEENPSWDPRVRMQMPGVEDSDSPTFGDMSDSTPSGRGSWAMKRMAEACQIGNMLSMDLSLADAALASGLVEKQSEDLLDGLPEEFIGPMIRYITAHEVGHCLGLQHNMAASTIRSLEEINSEGFEGPMIGSVMDYAGVNINHELGEVQGPYATTEVGPYDRWAIAFGYGPADKVEETLSRAAEPDLVYVSQIGMFTGADPRNMTWDMGSDNLEFCQSRLGLVKELRVKLVEDIVEDGESWAQVRRRFQSLVGTHVNAVAVAANWIGSTYQHNDFKGDPNGRPAIEDVPAEKQREALRMVIDNAFEDEAFGLTPELIRHMGKEYWWDPQGQNELMADPSYTAHSLVGGVQSAALTMVMNPTTLRRVYDNEFRTAGEDSFTLSELVDTVSENVWRECSNGSGTGSISSFRRNLQREHAERLISLSLMDTSSSSPSMRTIASLARSEIRRIDGLVKKALDGRPDAYTEAHLQDVHERFNRALEASYTVGG